MTKEELLSELSNNTWVMIKPSGIHGIGVFAVRDIPAGCREIWAAGAAACLQGQIRLVYAALQNEL